jgi:hypothetical protein
VGLALSQMAVELVDVHPVGLPCAGLQADLVPVDVEPGTAQGFSQGIEGAPQGGPAPGGVTVGPEQVHQGIAPVTLAGDGQVGQQGDGLAPVDLERNPVALKTGWAKQVQSQAGHHGTSLLLSVLETRRKVNRNGRDSAVAT